MTARAGCGGGAPAAGLPVQPLAAVPIHYDDYPVFKSPLADFQRLAARQPLPTSLFYLGRGESLPLVAG